MTSPTLPPGFVVRAAREQDVALILSFVRDLAEYEKLSHEVEATEELLRETLFGPAPAAEVMLGYLNEEPVAFALFFSTFSTFIGRPGIYLEDLYVKPNARSRGIGKLMLRAVARMARERGAGRLEWSVLDWNEPALRFYRSLGAVPMEEWTVHRVSGKALERLADGV